VGTQRARFWRTIGVAAVAACVGARAAVAILHSRDDAAPQHSPTVAESPSRVFTESEIAVGQCRIAASDLRVFIELVGGELPQFEESTTRAQAIEKLRTANSLLSVKLVELADIDTPDQLQTVHDLIEQGVISYREAFASYLVSSAGGPASSEAGVQATTKFEQAKELLSSASDRLGAFDAATCG
jgi:hypothetical protein